jgi:acetyl-CoA synthetase
MAASRDIQLGLDWFDTVAAGNDRPALWIIDDDDTETRLTFAVLTARSNALAAWLRNQGVRRGDRSRYGGHGD